MASPIHLINDNRFKKNIVKINFTRPVKKEELTKLNFLTHLILLATKNYPSEMELVKKARLLYDLGMEAFVSLYGNAVILSLRFVFLKDAYTEVGLKDEVLAFIKEVIFNPYIVNDGFVKENFETAYRETAEEIKTFSENKAAYSKLRMLECMDSTSPSAYASFGYLDDLVKINPQSLYDFYLEVVKNSNLDVFAFGDFKVDDFLEFKRQNKHFSYICTSKINHEQICKEKDQIKQSRLVIGYNLMNLTVDEAVTSLPIYLYLLGGGPNSKLFQNVREKNSLCYSINAKSRFVNSLLTITAGIDAINFEQALSVIKDQVKALEIGDFSNEELAEAKLNIKAGYEEILENPYAIINSYEANYYLGFALIPERLEKIDVITKEDVITVAKRLNLNTIYLLEGTRK